MKHTLVATMENHPSTFNKVLSLFRCRGFAIDSLAVGHTDVPNIMRLTIVVDGSRTAVEQVVKQLYKIIEVRKVSDVSEDQTVRRELALIKVTSKPATRGEIRFCGASASRRWSAPAWWPWCAARTCPRRTRRSAS